MPATGCSGQRDVSAAFAKEARTGVDPGDAEFLERFESCELPESEWTHLAHIRVAWICLQLEAPQAAVDRIRGGILHYNTDVLRRPHRYHDTVTVAFTRLVFARMREGEAWRDFSTRIDDLLDPNVPILGKYYSAGLLDSDEARRRYVTPDLRPLPGID